MGLCKTEVLIDRVAAAVLFSRRFLNDCSEQYFRSYFRLHSNEAMSRPSSGYSTHGNRVRYVFAGRGATVAIRALLLARAICRIGSKALRMFLGALAVVFGNLCSHVFAVRTALRDLERPR